MGGQIPETLTPKNNSLVFIFPEGLGAIIPLTGRNTILFRAVKNPFLKSHIWQIIEDSLIEE